MNDTSVVDLVDGFLKTRYIAENARDYTHFHPSEFHGCKRQVAYKYYLYHGIISVDQEKLIPEPGMLRIFDNGHSVHRRWGRYFKDERCARDMLKGFWRCSNAYAHELAWKVKDVKKEDCKPKIYGKDQSLGILYPRTPCECGCPDFEYEEIGFFDETTFLGGHIDGLLLYPTGEHLIIDYKSIKARNYGKLYGAAKEEHATQMQCYLYLSGLNVGKFIYENKDDQREVKEIIVKRDQRVIDFIISDAVSLKNALTTLSPTGKRLLPPKCNSLNPKADEEKGREIIRYTRGMSTCSYCPFKSICWKL